MVHVDKLNRDIERMNLTKQRKRLKQNLPSEEGRGSHKLARYFPECKEKLAV